MVSNACVMCPKMLRERYVKFMTTSGSHNDCYASSYHRMFFSNFERGLPLHECPDNDGHNVDTMDGLAITIPVALATASKRNHESDQAISEAAQVLRRSKECAEYS